MFHLSCLFQGFLLQSLLMLKISIFFLHSYIVAIHIAPQPVPGVTIPTQSISSSMLTINWMEPNVPNGVINYYTVYYLPVSGPYECIMTSNRRKRQLAQNKEFAMNFTETSATLTNLNGSVTYRIEVSAIALYNGVELVGDRSNEEVITTPDGGKSKMKCGNLYISTEMEYHVTCIIICCVV